MLKVFSRIIDMGKKVTNVDYDKPLKAFLVHLTYICIKLLTKPDDSCKHIFNAKKCNCNDGGSRYLDFNLCIEDEITKTNIFKFSKLNETYYQKLVDDINRCINETYAECNIL